MQKKKSHTRIKAAKKAPSPLEKLADRRSFLVGAHGVSGDQWAKRYGLLPSEGYCRTCNRPMRMTLPFAVGILRGLLAPPCECSPTETHTPFCVVAAQGDILDH